MAKHKAPSRIKYEKNNPNWTVRLTLYLFEVLQDFLEKSGLSRRDFIAIALGEQEMDYEKACSDGFGEGYDFGYDHGHDDGYEKAKKEFRLWHFCYICRKSIDIQPNSDAHKAIIEFMDLTRWGHFNCHNKQNNNQ
ncbi:MAG: hypothetical protein JSW62_02735 [Thermoplasmatales archaeon]|nr:MAG: hypothetical protein JSW62_02735 [Thermoplasmatales archaeon]